MLSKKSFFNKCLYFKNLKRFWPMWVLMSLVISIPAIATLLTYQVRPLEVWMRRSPMKILNEVTTSFVPVYMFGMAILSAMCVWSFLYGTKSAYSIHALPVTRLELFVTNFVSGITLILIPSVVGTVFETISVTALYGFSGLGILKLIVAGLIEMLFFFAFATVIAMLVGHIVFLPLAYLFFSFVVMAIEGEFGFFLSGYCPGVYENYEGRLIFLSPIVWIYDTVNVLYSNSVDSIENYNWLFILIPVALALIVLAFFMYTKKDLEYSGQAIAIKQLKSVMTVLLTTLGTTSGAAMFVAIFNSGNAERLFEITGNVILYMMICATISYSLVLVIINGTVKIVNKKRVCTLLIIFLLIIAGNVMMKADVLGLVEKVPDSSKVQSITYDIDCIGKCETSNPETISKLIEVHKLMADGAKKYDKNYYSVSSLFDTYSNYEYIQKKEKELFKNFSFSVEYTLKNGRKLRRIYEGYAIDMNQVKNPDSLAYKFDQISRTPEYVNNKLHIGEQGIYLVDCYLDGWISSKEEYMSASLVNPIAKDELLNAIAMDAMAGNIPMRNFYSASEDYIVIELRYSNGIEENYYDNCAIYVNRASSNINKFLVEKGYISEDLLEAYLNGI